ncbi:MarR family winged helix-turn-helix transcriptional regulator [Arenibacterium halophilum]|uniref:MarR family transcriptional regulator n=1 Tax=Arenibacterium halophilum TaxID=2583821 RepID=A0ABY2X6M1_9RHOB|nr:MarR family transcriptional regulator [Arenibacterium halophilum]TMV11434.1 MarR family transcriptional regulator [Arenibacterium halophilum]
MPPKDDFDLHAFLPYLLNQAAEASSLGFQASYKGRYGMLRTDWRVLFHLGIHGRMTAKDIGERAKIHKTKVSRAVQRLADRRFLTRERDESDRRSEFLELTQAGQAAYRDLRAIAQEYEARLTARFSAEDTVLLKRLLVELAR